MRCKNCGYKVWRGDDGNLTAGGPIGTWCRNEGAHEVEPFALTDTRSFTSSAIVSPVVLSAHVRAAIGEVNQAAALVTDRLVPDGDFEITVTVRQKMKPKE